MTVIPDLKTLYEIDDSLWLEETIELLKAKRFDALDLENLIEELEDLGNEKKFRIASFLQQIIRLIRNIDDLPVTMYPISYKESNLPGMRSLAAK